MISHSLPVIDRPPPIAVDGPPDWHRFRAGDRDFVYVADGSQIYAVDGHEFDLAEREGDPMAALGIPRPQAIAPEPPQAAPIRALSLAVAQKCNLACSYCYAEGGDFGALPKSMSTATARAAVDRLFAAARPGDRVNLSFLGGEPLLARDVLRDATDYAEKLGRRREVAVGFAITTNATLLTSNDAAFFEQHEFAVTVSIDGTGEIHDRQRPFRGGGGSYDRVMHNASLLLVRRIQVFVRATVTSASIDLRQTLDRLLAAGFRSVGFAPLLAAPNGKGELAPSHLADMLLQMIDCGREFERRVIAGETYAFANMIDAMSEVHRGSHRAYPCGAGNGYFGVSADGELSACHRFVGDANGAMGTVADGIDALLQQSWLESRHVHRQEPCRSCWARYLCGGGCHHEVLRRGRPACDFIRGWLIYALEAYVRILSARPEYFQAPSHVDRM